MISFITGVVLGVFIERALVKYIAKKNNPEIEASNNEQKNNRKYEDL